MNNKENKIKRVLNSKLTINKKIVVFSLIALILSMIVPITYAFFAANVQGNNNVSNNVVQSGTMRLVLTDGNVIGTTSDWIPGSYITKSFTVENTGTLPASYSITLESVTNTFVDKTDLVYEIVGTSSGTSSAYSTSNANQAPSRDAKIINSQTINAGDIHTYTLTLTFLSKNENQNDNMGKSFTGKIQLYDINNSPNFELPGINSSWSDIIAAYNAGNIEQLQEDMENNVTRDIDLGSYGVHKLRIANLTPCSEVDVISESACGLVIEFADVITHHRFNPLANNGNVNGDGNKGGWKYSEMRAFINSTTYENGNIDYSSSGILDKFPNDLKLAIISTNVVSGYGIRDNSNFTSSDYLYLLSSKEVLNDSNVAYDTSSIQDSSTNKYYTRQLDYYEFNEVSRSNSSPAIKKYGNENDSWWLRSPLSYQQYNYGNYTYIYGDGNNNNSNVCIYEYGVSPAFRLAD